MKHPADRFPIVISAMAGMFPGAANLDAYWQRIRNAEVAPLTDLGQRWELPRDRYFADKPGVPDRTYVDQAFCLPQDAGANASDLPDRQARIGQAVLRQCLADLPGKRPSRIGLVLATEWTAGSWFERTAYLALQNVPELDLPTPPAVGFSPDRQLHAIAEGLTGPKLAVDAACASSLYGLDLAQRLLRAGRADAVAVMGLTAWLPPFLLTAFSQLMALSPENRLLPYAENASGILLGEACGVLLVEPMAAALAAGRPILAVLRRQGLSSDGADRSVFAPGREGQRLMYERAYCAFEPGSLDYLEGHGTATRLGDETELAVMRDFFGAHYSPERPLPIGGVKGLIGHTLAAAGIASTIKALLMLQHRELPPHNAVVPNPALADSSLTLLGEPTPWLAHPERARRIGISSFGFGGCNSHLLMEEYRPQDWTAPAGTVQPWRPIAIVDFEATRGTRLPDQLTVEAQGLRMGPNFLKRIDPYQLLLTDLAHRLAERQPELANDAFAGVVIGSNLGGELMVKLMRRSLWLTRHRPGTADVETRADLYGPKHSLESIASCMPNMCSGYPAFHFNLRGFHQTISGGPGVFWDQLALAPEWLGDACDRLLLGAGRINKSIEEKSAEGAALFLLQEPGSARQPIGMLHALIPADVAADFDSACAIAGMSPAQFDWRGTSDAAAATAGAGFEEAAGPEVLIAALREAKRWAAIEVRANGCLQYTVLLEKLAAPEARPIRHHLPLTVTLREAAAQAAANTVPQAIAPQPVDLSNGLDEARARLWLQSTTAAMQDFFAAQRASLALLRQSSPVTAVADVRSRPPRRQLHDVLQAPTRLDDGSLQAQLTVNQEHPYFFDHPLDHAPGILLLEGILQLAEWGIAAPAGQETWVRSIKLMFRRFCEKNLPITLALQAGDDDCFNGQVFQDGAIACSVDLHIGTVAPSPATSRPEPTRGRPDRKLLHKHRDVNVMVTPLFDLADGSKAVETYAPPAGHILEEGSPHHYSMLYLLETTRQFVMLIAHEVWMIPLGMPMNLLSIQLQLDRSVPRGLPLTISYRPSPLGEHKQSAIVLVEAVLQSGDERVGRASIVAQGLTPEAYRQQRNSTGVPAK